LRAEVVLTPSESKRLIGKAVASMDVVKKALKSGLIIIGRGTTNSFVAEEILGKSIVKSKYARGIIYPGQITLVPAEEALPEVIIENGKLSDKKLDEAVKALKSGDVVIKGANALDVNGVTGVFIARSPQTTGGTVGLVYGPAMCRGGISFIIPVGLEKLIPVPIKDVVAEVSQDIAMSTGFVVGMLPTIGTVVTEIEAFKILADVEAINIGAGGVGGAEGARIFLLKGDENNVKKAFEIVKSIQGEPALAK